MSSLNDAMSLKPNESGNGNGGDQSNSNTPPIQTNPTNTNTGNFNRTGSANVETPETGAQFQSQSREAKARAQRDKAQRDRVQRDRIENRKKVKLDLKKKSEPLVLQENEKEDEIDRSMSILSNTKLNTSLSSEAQKQITKKVEQMTKKIIVKEPEVVVNESNRIVKRSFSDLYQDKSVTDQLKFVTNRVKPNSNAKVPDTVRALDNYCQRFGYLSMGQVVDAPGKYYLGRRITNGKQGKIQYVVPHFEKNIFIETPDIGKNLCHFANKTVSKWNDFSKAEGQLQVYTNLMKQTSLQDYEEMTVRKCSHGTTIYKLLATLFYFYIERKQDILNLSLQNRDILDTLLRTKQSISLQDAYQVLLETIRDQPETKLIRFIRQAKTEVKLALIASTGAQSQNLIETFINDPNAYLDPSMMKNPRRETPKWIQKFSGQKSFANLFTTQKWQPHSEYMKPDNYFNF